jgi:hypothetical protein
MATRPSARTPTTVPTSHSGTRPVVPVSDIKIFLKIGLMHAQLSNVCYNI